MYYSIPYLIKTGNSNFTQQQQQQQQQQQYNSNQN